MISKGLEALGIKSGQDAQHSHLVQPADYEAERYFAQARDLLLQATVVVLEEIVPQLEKYAGRWNPGGFMVFLLGLTEDGSSLRLHVSAEGMRRDILNGPFIHNHGWQLISRVLAGEYSDQIFDVKKEPSADVTIPEKGILRLYETRRNANGIDELVTDGTIVKATPIEDREIHAGEFHSIEAMKVYHKPTTPSDRLAATLVLDSPAFTKTTHVLLANSEPITLERRRIALEQESIEVAKEQLSKIT